MGGSGVALHVRAAHAQRMLLQNVRADFKPRSLSPALSGTAVGLALELWQLVVEHLPVQLAAEALAAAILLCQQEVAWSCSA
jgi:hypothetical protein